MHPSICSVTALVKWRVVWQLHVPRTRTASCCLCRALHNRQDYRVPGALCWVHCVLQSVRRWGFVSISFYLSQCFLTYSSVHPLSELYAETPNCSSIVCRTELQFWCCHSSVVSSTGCWGSKGRICMRGIPRQTKSTKSSVFCVSACLWKSCHRNWCKPAVSGMCQRMHKANGVLDSIALLLLSSWWYLLVAACTR